MTSRTARLLTPLAALLLAGSACGGQADPQAEPPADPPASPTATVQAEPAAEPTDQPSEPAPAIDVCALLTKEEAERVVSTALEELVATPEACTYTGPVDGPVAQVEIYVGDGAKKILDTDRILNHEFEEIAGLGEEAYLEEGAAFVLKDGVWAAIRVVRLEDRSTYEDALVEALRTVAGRM